VDRDPQTEERRRRAGPVLTVLAAVVILAAAVTAGVALTKSPQAKMPAPVASKLKTAVILAPPAGSKLAFSSDFSGRQLDHSTWSTCYSWANSAGCTNFGNKNEEKEWYQASQVSVSNGVLRLTAQHAPTAGLTASGAPEEYGCRSGMVTTDPGFHFQYGYVQMVARLPYSAGLWSAFWLAAANHKWPPEVDVVEHWDAQSVAKFYLHPATGPRQGGPVPVKANLSQGWHTFTLSWTRSRMTWYVDGHQVMTTTTSIPQQAMYLIANLADTSTAASSCSGTMLIKSIKVWQPS
jgi:beta-glucanase (GH16 family)